MKRTMVVLMLMCVGALGCSTTPEPVVAGGDLALVLLDQTRNVTLELVDASWSRTKRIYEIQLRQHLATLIKEFTDEEGSIKVEVITGITANYAAQRQKINDDLDKEAAIIIARLSNYFNQTQRLMEGVTEYNKARGISPEAWARFQTEASGIVTDLASIREGTSASENVETWEDRLTGITDRIDGWGELGGILGGIGGR